MKARPHFNESPTPFQKQAQETGLQDTLIWSIMRQESAFNARTLSRSGARGLMQLMPKTARYVSKKHKLGHISNEGLFLPAANIRLGTWYLSDLLKRFGNQQLAIVAYNAGPTRVKRWLKRTSFDKQPELWVELIPFKETRRYVQQVTAFTAVYNWRKQ
ncbi:MAG: lytic transglycosylase domain-containing protein [Mariprofundaceae bacterium]|nr:lytic transglycosylase domain-containing protein [Mariprofundaceae bacterium]